MKTFLEIGSCDFQTLNHFSDHGWQGAIVEPMKKYLNNIPQKPNVHYLNYAVDDKVGTRILYHASDKTVKEDRDFAGMSSFLPPRPAYEVLTEETIVNTITFEKIFEFTGFTQIDYLKIDVEEYDLELLKIFPFHITKPSFIKIEYWHLGHEPFVDILEKQGYHCEISDRDIYATKL